MTALTQADGSAKYDFSDFDFGYGDLDATLAKGVAEAVRNSIECDFGLLLDIDFKDDGARLVVFLPFGESGDWVTYETTLFNVIEDWIGGEEETPDRARIARDRLLALASGLHKISNIGTDVPMPDFTEYVMPERMLHTIKEQLDFLDEQIGAIDAKIADLGRRKTYLENYKIKINAAVEGAIP